MKRFQSLIPVFLCFGTAALAGNHDPKAIAAALPEARLTLLEGIAKAEQTNGPATSAKFEIDDHGKLVLSVYNVPEGLESTPEAATLLEVVYLATEAESVGSVEVFADKEHIARAATHMTLFQLSTLSLTDVVRAAMSIQGGNPIDVRNPTVVDHRAVADVVLLDATNSAFTVTIDLLTGKPIVSK